MNIALKSPAPFVWAPSSGRVLVAADHAQHVVSSDFIAAPSLGLGGSQSPVLFRPKMVPTALASGAPNCKVQNFADFGLRVRDWHNGTGAARTNLWEIHLSNREDSSLKFSIETFLDLVAGRRKFLPGTLVCGDFDCVEINEYYQGHISMETHERISGGIYKLAFQGKPSTKHAGLELNFYGAVFATNNHQGYVHMQLIGMDVKGKNPKTGAEWITEFSTNYPKITQQDDGSFLLQQGDSNIRLLRNSENSKWEVQSGSQGHYALFPDTLVDDEEKFALGSFYAAFPGFSPVRLKIEEDELVVDSSPKFFSLDLPRALKSSPQDFQTYRFPMKMHETIYQIEITYFQGKWEITGIDSKAISFMETRIHSASNTAAYCALGAESEIAAIRLMGIDPENHELVFLVQEIEEEEFYGLPSFYKYKAKSTDVQIKESQTVDAEEFGVEADSDSVSRDFPLVENGNADFVGEELEANTIGDDASVVVEEVDVESSEAVDETLSEPVLEDIPNSLAAAVAVPTDESFQISAKLFLSNVNQLPAVELNFLASLVFYADGQNDTQDLQKFLNVVEADLPRSIPQSEIFSVIQKLTGTLQSLKNPLHDFVDQSVWVSLNEEQKAAVEQFLMISTSEQHRAIPWSLVDSENLWLDLAVILEFQNNHSMIAEAIFENYSGKKWDVLKQYLKVRKKIALDRQGYSDSLAVYFAKGDLNETQFNRIFPIAEGGIV